MSTPSLPKGPAYALARAFAAGADTDADLDRVGIAYTNEIKVELSKPGSGRWYGRHRASAPGEPPAVDTGVYRASWTHSRAGQVVSMYPRLPAGDHPGPLGQWLEFGTSRMAPRPHARPTTARMLGVIPGIFASGIAQRQRRAVRGR